MTSNVKERAERLGGWVKVSSRQPALLMGCNIRYQLSYFLLCICITCIDSVGTDIQVPKPAAIKKGRGIQKTDVIKPCYL